MYKMSYIVLLSKIKNIHRKARIVMILGSSIVTSGDTQKLLRYSNKYYCLLVADLNTTYYETSLNFF